MAQKNDQIFQLSLTEIAFCIIFILLILLGYQVIQEQEARKKAEEILVKIQSLEETKNQLEVIRLNFSEELNRSGAASPDDLITKLLDIEKTREENQRLRKKIEDLDAQITALAELQKLIEKNSNNETQLVKEEIQSALILQAEARRELDKQDEKSAKGTEVPIKNLMSTNDSVKLAISTAKTIRAEAKSKLGQELEPKTEGQSVVEIVDAASSFAELSKNGINIGVIRKENSDLRGQVAFLKRRLDARGGRDYPPCWADENGKVEFLFAIELRSDSVRLTPAWPAKREADAQALPGITAALAEAHAYSRFPAAIMGAFNWSKAQDPECRHYVQLKSSIQDAVQSDRARLMVENYFYKVEMRR